MVFTSSIKNQYYYKIICIMTLISLIFYLSTLFFIITTKPARPQSLPKIVWTYQQSQDGNFLHSLCFQRIKNVLEQSRWVLQVLTPTNIFVYLQEHEQYKQMIKNYHQELVFTQQMQIIKLFILKEYGGIWIDPSTILLESVDWIHHLQSINGISTYQNNAYQMVFFQSKNIKKQSQLFFDGDGHTNKIASINLGIILALKQTPLISKWITKLNEQIKKIIQVNEQQNAIKKIANRALSSLLQNNVNTFEESLKLYKIWKFKYSDLSLQDIDNPYILTDFYLKYPYESIKNSSKNHKYFILLDRVSKQLDQILNPNISKLSYLSHLSEIGGQHALQFKCAHYLSYKSIIYALLIKGTQYQPLYNNSIDKNNQLARQCSSFYQKQWLREITFVINCTFWIIFIYMIIKIQKLCLQLIWARLKIFIKPNQKIYKSILKTLKNIVQYQGNEAQ